MVIARPVIVLLGYRFEAGHSPHRFVPGQAIFENIKVTP
jgi:hypothetical protein